MKRILITGVAGFIGSYLAKQILSKKEKVNVIGIDNLNSYYDVKLKKWRLKQLEDYKTFIFIQGDICDKKLVQNLFNIYQPEIVVNLAAQAGVRYSINNPDSYITSNIIGFYNILEACRYSYDIVEKMDGSVYHGVQHLVYASSSSVYGCNKKVPYSIEDKADNPVSLYAATKKSNELMAYAYSKLFSIPSTALRFFTVYGPAGRPDMAYFKFTNQMVNGEEIRIYNNGNMERDFTYIDDIIKGIMYILKNPPKKDNMGTCHKIYNIGNSKPEKLLYFIDILERCLLEEGIINTSAKKKFLPMQLGDVYCTYADIENLKQDFNFTPSIQLEEGLRRFVKWYKKYYF
jgi:nucleoside-diphosphate-sugar epimerase